MSLTEDCIARAAVLAVAGALEMVAGMVVLALHQMAAVAAALAGMPELAGLVALQQIQQAAQPLVAAVAAVVAAGHQAWEKAAELGSSARGLAAQAGLREARRAESAALAPVGLESCTAAAVALQTYLAALVRFASYGPATCANSHQHAQQTNKGTSWNTHN